MQHVQTRAPGARTAILMLTLTCLLSLPLAGQWVQQGPGPSTNGQSEIPTDNLVSGAVNCVTPHPTTAATVYIGGANGGVWRSTNATAANPSWEFISSDLPSQAIGALEFDPTDGSNQTLVVGNAFTSSLGSRGAGRRGLFRTTSGTGPWTDIDPSGTLGDVNILGVAPRGNTIVVATPNGLWRTTNGGSTWNQLSGAAGSGLPPGATFDLVGDPTSSAVLFTHVGSTGIYRSTDTGATWTKVSDTTVDGALSGANNVELAVGSSNNLFVAVVTGGQLAGLYRQGSVGGSWQSLDLPATTEGCRSLGIHPGGQGGRHLSLAADPADANVVYIGGDRQPVASVDGGCVPASTVGWPNSIGANDFSGRLFRVDAAQPAGSQAAPITHNGTAGNTSPHADSRDMDFDAAGNLLEGDDGGIYRQNSPADATGDWTAAIGNLNVSEAHSMDWDANANILINGLQDNGTPQQVTPTDPQWRNVSGGDGGDVAVDDITAASQSTRFSSSQRLGGFRSRTYSSGNSFQSGSQSFPALVNTATGNSIFSDPLVPVGFPFVTPIRINDQNGNRLLISTGNGLFESNDQGATVTRILTSALNTASGDDVIAYGAADNVNVIYAGQGANVLIRTTATGSLNATMGYTGGVVQGIVVDPSTAANAYVIDRNNVYATNNSGSTFPAVTGNLATLNPGTLHTITFIPNSTGNQLAVGSDNGVYLAAGPAFNTWTRLGTDLPGVMVYDLDYSAPDQVLLAGTLGRGSWSYALTERDPVDVALVMDLSGSMLNPACSGCATKLDVLKDAAEIFIQLWKGLAVGDDRLGNIYFRTDVDAFTSGPDVLLPVIANGDALIADLRGQTTTSSSLTAMGGGIQLGVNQLTDTDRPRHLIVFTDGIQNVDPGVSDPALEIRNGEYGTASNINPSSPVTVLNSGLGIKVHTVGVGASPAFAGPLADIAGGTGALTKVTTAPDEDLIRFYVEELVEVLRDFSPQLITYRNLRYNGKTAETVDVNPSTNRLVFKVSYPRGTGHDIRIFKGQTEVTRRAVRTTGDFYQIFSFPFTFLRELEQTEPGTTWRVQLTGPGTPTDVQLAVLADEKDLDYRLFTNGPHLLAGEPLRLFAELSAGGERFTSGVTVRATVLAPAFSLGDFLSDFQAGDDQKLTFEPGTPVGQRTFEELLQEPGFDRRLRPRPSELELRPRDRGLFTADFPDTRTPGTYRIEYRITGRHPLTGPFERVETRTVVVRPAQIDPGASDISAVRTRAGWTWRIRPVDRLGNRYGPDYLERLTVEVSGGEITDRREFLNGTYEIDVRGDNPKLKVTLGEDEWFSGPLEEG
ncbi:VWA domain-containing protein [Lewinella sp. IMCC34183]|uniref:VWA domain-containing protein n=1 Tax=Lewinella sp. IMCC34183 TaxID=2248762 RepID=UPI000E235DCF|nr:VWA domain-containing protein [Lewinella sp. IMCC34183]